MTKVYFMWLLIYCEGMCARGEKVVVPRVEYVEVYGGKF